MRSMLRLYSESQHWAAKKKKRLVVSVKRLGAKTNGQSQSDSDSEKWVSCEMVASQQRHKQES
jgi:hypothetical protein